MSVLIVLLAATGSMLPVCSTRQKDPVGTCQYASKFDSLKARNLAITQVPGRERESKQSSRGSAANTGGNVAQGSGFEGLLGLEIEALDDLGEGFRCATGRTAP